MMNIFYCLIIYDIFHFQGNSSGTTAICTFIRGKTLYAAWLGDSQAVLVRNGQAVKIVEPHKPNRPVSTILMLRFSSIDRLVFLKNES